MILGNFKTLCTTQFFFQFAMQFFSYEMLTSDECLLCKESNEYVYTSIFTSLKGRIALQVSRKTVSCDMDLNQKYMYI